MGEKGHREVYEFPWRLDTNKLYFRHSEARWLKCTACLKQNRSNPRGDAIIDRAYYCDECIIAMARS
jgi:hypothetical protein